MESESLKIQYFKQQIEAGVRDILDAQRVIAGSRMRQSGMDRVRSGRGGDESQGRGAALMEALNHPQYIISSSGGGVVTEITLPLQIRFLDIKRLGDWRIYNRPIWGTLYKNTLNNIKYEWRDWIRSRVSSALKQPLSKR